MNCTSKLTAGVLALLLAAGAAAQTKLITLGTQGGPIPKVQRSQPATAVVVRDRVYLFDAGNGVARQLVAAGFNFRQVERIFITHHHDDHNADVGTLMGLQWATGRRAPTHVYGPAGMQSMMQGFLQYFQPNARIRSADSKGQPPPEKMFIAHDIPGSGPVYEDEFISVTAQENCHYAHDSAATRPGIDKSYAYRIKTPDKVIVISGDTGPCPVLEAFSRDADLLVHEVIDLPLIEKGLRGSPATEALMRHMIEEHTTAEEVGRLATAARVKQVVLTHVIPGGDEPDSVYLEPLRKHFKGPATVARDLMSF
ncbi:MBL fold metallo-hydrolase [Ramlibacter albus]|uniref:MBL fold metallo-hydrolase n=1 Tax=Ramlibacter albus TaxID=2079448 RepID=A0A923S3T5_9BURK|nr:MBL fold metallo-hydrolase [Ramlibacter albus]MBC5766761.1 MBL fold metallo-hydrolase [Ramlibacter albus]